jgi:hypothetical protein
LASLEALDGWEKDLIRQADSPIFLLSIYTKKANPTNKNTLFFIQNPFRYRQQVRRAYLSFSLVYGRVNLWSPFKIWKSGSRLKWVHLISCLAGNKGKMRA